jgi:hypothetical protein
MNILELIKEGLRIARTSRSLWLYGFFVGLGALNSGNKGHVPAGPPPVHVPPHALTGATALLAFAVLVLLAAGVFMYFVSAGALIEGVSRVRQARPQTVRDGWHDGLAHWGVLLRITIIYVAANVTSLGALATPALLALKFSGTPLAVTLAIPATLVAAPWLVTLYMWQAFASRIAVLENRHARDAIGKARLFLHGRLLQGLKLIVAAVLGRLIVLAVGSIGLLAAAACVFVVLKIFGLAHAAAAVVTLGAVVLLPIVFILVAISGTTQSSIWTIGYLTQGAK